MKVIFPYGESWRGREKGKVREMEERREIKGRQMKGWREQEGVD